MDCDIGVGSGRKLEQMRVVAHEEGAQQLRIVRAHRSADARTFGKLRTPCADLRQILEDAEFDQFIEHVEITEDGGEHRIDEIEGIPRKEWAGRYGALAHDDLPPNALAL